MLDAYRELLSELAQALGLQPEDLLQTEELDIDGHVVGLLYDGDESLGELVLFCGLGVPSDARKAEVYDALLQANCLWVGTSGGTLGVHPDSRVVMLSLRYPIEGTTADTLVQVLRIYLEAADYWCAFVGGQAPLPVDAAVTDDRSMPVEALMLFA